MRGVPGAEFGSMWLSEAGSVSLLHGPLTLPSPPAGGGEGKKDAPSVVIEPDRIVL